MRMRFVTLLVAVCASCGAALGNDISNTYTYSLDTECWPRSFKTEEDIAALDTAVRKLGETVTLISSDGESTTLVSAESNVESVELPMDKGGMWTLSNSRQGTVVYTVRHSLSGTVGEGTEESPARIVDGDELIDYSVSNGYVFKLEGLQSLFEELRLPDNVRLELVNEAEDTWRLVADNSGLLHAWGEFTYSIDSLRDGPNRMVSIQGERHIAYSGDGWIGNDTSLTKVTFTPPKGSGISPTTLNLTGTGTISFQFSKTGSWTIELEMANGEKMKSTILVVGGMTVILK